MKNSKLHLVSKLVVSLFLILGLNGTLISQTITITGPMVVGPGQQAFYQANFSYTLNPQSIISWSCTLGTIVIQNVNPSLPIDCTVQWGNTTGIGTLTIYETPPIGPSRSASIDVKIVCGEADGGPNVTLCSGGCSVIGVPAQPGYSYSWTPTTGLSNPNIAQPTACPLVTTVYTVTMTPINGNGCPVIQTSLTVTVNPTPTITPQGPIEKCVHYETGPWLTLTTNIASNIQWYENGNPINGQISSNLILTNNPNNGINWPTCTSSITVQNTLSGCLSNPVQITRKNFSSPLVYPSNSPVGPYETPINYCVSQGGVIKQVPSLTDPNTIYWWLVNDPTGNPASGVSISPMFTTNPNATISFPTYTYPTATIIAKALDNGCVGSTDGSWNQIYTINVNQSCKNINTQFFESSVNNISIFPNPASSQVTITLKRVMTEIEIIDINNVTSYLKKRTDGSKTITLDISGLKPGIYLCKVVTKTKTEFLKMQVVR